jgi:RNA polymerase sigma factor (sigma-70 family)
LGELAGEAARKRVAIEMVARHEGSLRRTARRYSLCEDDADDAYQRSLEILLTKAPTDDLRELIRWTQTVIKHEALAVRRDRERMLAGPPAGATGEPEPDWVALIPADGADPAERVERREAIARSREALQSLRPQELRALTLLAEGYSYAEIGAMTGYSRTKVNRCLAEGRDRFRRLLSSSLDGSRCDEMRPLLSAFCDGESEEGGTRAVREHLRACANCRSTLRAYRAAPRAVAALAPGLPMPRTLLERAHEMLAGIQSRLPGQGAAEPTISQVAAAGGSKGIGVTALAKLLAICVGTAGGAAACVASGVVPAPAGLGAEHSKPITLERPSPQLTGAGASTGSDVTYEPAPIEPDHPTREPAPAPTPEPAPVSTPAAGGVEYAPEEAAPVAAVSTPPTGAASSSSGSAAGEFGP